MEPLLRPFTLSFLLRSLFAGAFFVVSYTVAAQGAAALVPAATTLLFSLALPLSLFAGVAVYGVHRALIYPLVEYVLGTSRAKRWRESCPLIANVTVEALLKIWAMAAENGKETQERARNATVWGDVVHQQYVSALCIVAGASTRVLTVPGEYVWHWPLFFLAVLFLGAGLVADWRLNRIRDRMLEGQPESPRVRIVVAFIDQPRGRR